MSFVACGVEFPRHCLASSRKEVILWAVVNVCDFCLICSLICWKMFAVDKSEKQNDHIFLCCTLLWIKYM